MFEEGRKCPQPSLQYLNLRVAGGGSGIKGEDLRDLLEMEAERKGVTAGHLLQSWG